MSFVSVPCPRPSLVEARVSSLPASDPRARLAQAYLHGTLDPDAAQLLLGLKHACPTFSLRDLPPEVALKIVESRGKAVDAMLKGWSESIRQNAAADKAADQRRYLANIVQLAQSRGLVETTQAQDVRRTASLADPDTVPDLPAALTKARSTPIGLAPATGGVRLR